MKSEIEKYLPLVLKKYRHRVHLSQQRLADYVGISKGYIAAIEVGRTIPNVAMLFRLAKVYEVPVEDILKDLRELMENAENEKIVKTDLDMPFKM